MIPATLTVPLSACDLTTNWQALSYLAEALAEYDPACLAFALAMVARSRGVYLAAVVPADTSTNAPDGALVAPVPRG